MKNHPLLLSALLIAGTSIGVGILIFPVITASAGVLPSLLLFILLGGLFAASGIALADVFLDHPTTPNILTLTKHLLGPTAQRLIGLLYLILLYSLTVAYIGLCGEHISTFSHQILSPCVASYVVAFCVAIFLLRGSRLTSGMNAILMALLVVTYLSLVISGLPHLNPDYLMRTDWVQLPASIPVLVTSFGYHPIIPSIIPLLGGQKKQVRKAIIYGCLLTLVLYGLWEIVLLGTLPSEGPLGLIQAGIDGHDVLTPLYHLTELSLIRPLGLLFAFLAIMTSFLGVSLGLVEILIDGLPAVYSQRKRWVAVLLALLPPTLVATTYPQFLISILEFGAAPAVVLLLIVLPFFLKFLLMRKAKQPKTITSTESF